MIWQKGLHSQSSWTCVHNRHLPTELRIANNARLDRFRLPTHRAPQSATLLLHTSVRLDIDQPHNRRSRPTARPPTAQHRQRNLAVRARPLFDTKDQLHHRRPLLRQPSMLCGNMPRNASLRMAVPLRRPRPSQVLLRHRLLLPHARLGCFNSLQQQAVSLKTRPWLWK